MNEVYDASNWQVEIVPVLLRNLRLYYGKTMSVFFNSLLHAEFHIKFIGQESEFGTIL